LNNKANRYRFNMTEPRWFVAVQYIGATMDFGLVASMTNPN
jgi:hypothetical protein